MYQRDVRGCCCSVEQWERGISVPLLESASPAILVSLGRQRHARAPPAWPTECPAVPECEKCSQQGFNLGFTKGFTKANNFFLKQL